MAHLNAILLLINLLKKALGIMSRHALKLQLAEMKLRAIRCKQYSELVSHKEAFKKIKPVILFSPNNKALFLLKTQYAKKPKNPV